MRSKCLKLAALVILGANSPEPSHSYEMPYDPYPWCVFYSGDGGGGTNCGFLTLEQCRATVSGIGGFCGPNQFYNPHRPGSHSRKR